MADKNFGVKKIELIGSTGIPNVSSPTTLNLNANTVAISTDVSIGGKVQSDVIVGTGYSVGIGSTQPREALDVTGDILVTGGISTNGIGTAVSLNIVGNDLVITVGSLSTTFALS